MPYGVYRSVGDYGKARYYRGDPGLFGAIGSAIGSVTGVLGKVVPGPAGALARVATSVLRPTKTATRPVPTAVMPGVPGPMPGKAGGVQTTPYLGLPVHTKKKGRRMNVTNPKALRRAIRRQAGFVKLARKALQGTGYTVVSRSSRSKPRVMVSEHGPGSVTVRR